MVKRFEAFLNSRILKFFLIFSLSVSLLGYLIQIFYFEEFHSLEFNNTSFSMLLAREGLSAYKPIFKEIVLIAFYGPLNYLLPAFFAKLFHCAGSPYSFLVLYRLLGFFALLGVLYLTFIMVKKISKSENFALLVTNIILAKPWVVTSARPDNFALFCVLLALSIALKEDLSKTRLFLIGSLCLAAFLFHQRFLGLFMGLLIYFLLKRKIQGLCFFAFSFIFAGLLIILPLSIKTKGEVITHFFLANYITIKDSLTSSLLSIFLREGRLFFLLLVSGIFSFLAACIIGKLDIRRIIFFYAFFCLAINLNGLRLQGAAENVFLEMVVVLAFVIAEFIGLAKEKPFKEKIIKTYMLVMVFLLTFPCQNVFEVLRQWRAEILGRRARYDQTVGFERKLSQFITTPLFTDDQAVAYKTNHPESANTAYLYLDVFFPQGLSNLGYTRTKFRQGFYSTIILTQNCPIYRYFGKDIAQNYILTEKLNKWDIWKSRLK